MKIRSTLKHKTLVALCLIVFCVTAGLAHATTQDPAAPATGETIDLKSFKTRSGRTLFEAMKEHSLAMLVVVDPSCGECTQVKDSLRALRDRVEKTRIAYYVVMIPDGSDAEKYFSFADSLKLDVDSFVWTNANAKPGSLASMTKPSHVHITNEGLIVEKFPGVPSSTNTP
jgi:type IV pilus biogenesis protein CpaD/CtpE